MKNKYSAQMDWDWTIDLSLGSPYVFKDYLQNYLNDATPSRAIKLHELMPYNKLGVFPELEEQILRLHRKYHPNFINKNTKIVVSNGATHAIMALFHFASKQYLPMHVPAPFWFRLPDMATMQDLILTKEIHEEITSATALLTVPNNPDGKLQELTDKSKYKSVWYDCVYNWPWYFKNKNDWPHQAIPDLPEVAIFSLSKFSGHCGTRIGWMVVNDPQLANFLENYIEYDTSGVSVEAQLRAASVIKTFEDNNLGDVYKHIVDKRKTELSTVLKKIQEVHGQEFNIKNFSIENGMFAWIKDELNCFVLNDIAVMPGWKCGADNKYVRVNLCAEPCDWDEMVYRLNNYIVRQCDNL